MSYTVVDVSPNSNVCETGLLEHQDIILLDIAVNATDGNITWGNRFILEALNETTNVSIELCNIAYTNLCSEDSKSKTCFCLKFLKGAYLFRYRSSAQFQLSLKSLRVNGQIISGVKYPEIVSDAVNMTLSMSDRILPVSNSCSVGANEGSIVRFKFCVNGLNKPRLEVEYVHLKDVVTSSPCIDASVITLGQRNGLYFKYRDKCGRNFTIRCQMNGRSQDSTQKIDAYDTTDHDFKLKMAIAVVIILVLTSTFYFLFYLMRRLLDDNESKSPAAQSPCIRLKSPKVVKKSSQASTVDSNDPNSTVV